MYEPACGLQQVLCNVPINIRTSSQCWASAGPPCYQRHMFASLAVDVWVDIYRWCSAVFMLKSMPHFSSWDHQLFRKYSSPYCADQEHVPTWCEKNAGHMEGKVGAAPFKHLRILQEMCVQNANFKNVGSLPEAITIAARIWCWLKLKISILILSSNLQVGVWSRASNRTNGP